MDEFNLEPLIQSAMQGNLDAFTKLVGEYQNFAFRLAYGILHDRMEAEDAVQEAFTKAYFSFKKLKSPFAFHAWLSRIITNCCFDRAKKSQSAIQTEDLENRMIQEQIVSNEGLQAINRLSLQEALAKLAPQHRAVLILKEVHGFDYEEIAEILSVPVGTVKSRLHTSRMRMRDYLLHQDEEE